MNYFNKTLHDLPKLNIKKGSVIIADVYHQEHCKFDNTGACNCSPRIVYTEKDKK